MVRCSSGARAQTRRYLPVTITSSIAKNRFDGEWNNGRKSGQGVFAVEGGSTFEGQFVDGEIEGEGTKTWPDGRRYEGGFSRGEACGHGCFTSPTTGESYTGSWAQNKRHGQGKLVLANGCGQYVGEFQRHRYVRSVLYECYTGITLRVSSQHGLKPLLYSRYGIVYCSQGVRQPVQRMSVTLSEVSWSCNATCNRGRHELTAHEQ